MNQLTRTLTARRAALDALAGRTDRRAAPLPGGRWKLPGGGLATEDGKVKADDTKLALTYVISAASQDRDGEVLVPRGLEPWLWSYERAPVVLLDHEMSQPVGLSRDPGGALTVVISDQDVRATCHFHQETELAVQAYALAKAGVLGMASVGFIPHVGQFVPGPEQMAQGPADLIHFTGGGGLRILEWEMGEWSILPVGSNRDAVQVREALQKRWDNKPLCAPLKELLTPLASPRRPWAKGWTALPRATPGKTVDTTVQSLILAKKVYPSLAAALAWAKARGHDHSEARDAGTAWVLVQAGAPACAAGADCREEWGEGVTAVRCGACACEKSCGCGGSEMKRKDGAPANGNGKPDDDEGLMPGQKFVKGLKGILDAGLGTVEESNVRKFCQDTHKRLKGCAHKAYPDLAEKLGFGKMGDDDGKTDDDDDDDETTMEEKDEVTVDTDDDDDKEDDDDEDYEAAKKSFTKVTGKELS